MKKTERNASEPATEWKTPALKYMGHVSEIIQFPGGGKLSLVADDSGDEQRKPKGTENKS